MDATHLHLLLNHFPIIGSLLGTGIMLFGYYTSSVEVKKTACWTWLVIGMITIPVFITGEPAEETIEELAGVSESIIHRHEEAAELSIWLMGALGILSLLTLVQLTIRPHTNMNIAFLLATLLALAVFATMARTGYLGGQIRHTEIRASQETQEDGRSVTPERYMDEDD